MPLNALNFNVVDELLSLLANSLVLMYEPFTLIFDGMSFTKTAAPIIATSAIIPMKTTNIIFPLLSYRLQRKLHTSFTSQYSLEEIREMYTFSKPMQLKVNKLFSTLEGSLKVFELRGMRFPR